MPFEGTQRLVVPDRDQNAVRTDNQIRKPRRAVAPDAITTQEVESYIEMLGDGAACVEADTACERGVVKRTRSGRLGRRPQGIDAIAEIGKHAEDLEVSPARLEGKFADEVRRWIVR